MSWKEEIKKEDYETKMLRRQLESLKILIKDISEGKDPSIRERYNVGQETGLGDALMDLVSEKHIKG
jgi:hypothetical protein